MRMRNPPFTEFKRNSTSLDDFSRLGTSPIFMINNIPMMDLELREYDLISYTNPKVLAMPFHECCEEWYLYK